MHPANVLKTVELNFSSPAATPSGGVEAKALTEAQFLAGEDARGTVVVLEPETDLRHDHLSALVARSACGRATRSVHSSLSAYGHNIGDL